MRHDLRDTGERMVPEFHEGSLMYAEHMVRYMAAQQLATDKVVLDIASGSGYGTKLLASAAKKIYGVDKSEQAVAYAKKHYTAPNIEYLLGDTARIPLPDKSVDLVVTLETIEHLEEPEVFLREIKRVLKDNGLVAISTPNRKQSPKGSKFHLHEYTIQELKELLSKTFTHVKHYYQGTWTYVELSGATHLSKPNDVTDVTVCNFAPLSEEQYRYAFFLCSMRQFQSNITPIGGLGGLYSERSQAYQKSSYEKRIEKLERAFQDEVEAHKKTKIKLRMREHENHAITQSSSYKLARMLARTKGLLTQNVNRLRSLNPKRITMLATNRTHVKAAYNSSLFLAAFQQPAVAKIAVVLHLYYPEMLPFFSKKLQNLSGVEYDLYVTITEGKKDQAATILEYLPTARIAIVPNCGRDVLPFVQVIKQIEKFDYTKVLKIHSKKSPHRTDGQQWRDRIIDSLLPTSGRHINEILDRLEEKKTAIIGPTGEYVSMLVNFAATGHHLRSVLPSLLGAKVTDELMRYPNEYGFFGGTMFWARLDALLPIIHSVRVEDFEPELGQEDSTLAHALERLFCVVPELQHRDIFETGRQGIKKLPYHTTNIPKWSEYSYEEGAAS